MIDISQLASNSILICPNFVKNEYVKLQSKNFPEKFFKYLSKEEVIEGLNFNVDEVAALVYLYKECSEVLSLGKLYIKNLTNVKGTSLLDTLSNYYDILNKAGLIKYNKLFKYLFTSKVYIIGYSKLDHVFNKLLDDYNIKYEYLEEDYQNEISVKCYTNSDEEIKAFINLICEKIETGISLNNIFIYNVPNTYQARLDKYFRYLGIPVETRNDMTVFDSPYFNKFIELLKEHPAFEAYNILNSEITLDRYQFLPKLLQIITKYAKYVDDLDLFIELLTMSAKKTALSIIKYEESIKIIDDSAILGDDDYCYMLGFNLSDYPIICRDNDFLSDREKTLAGRLTSNEQNKINLDNLLSFIRRTKNLEISRSLKDLGTITFPTIISNYIKVNEIASNVDNIRYSVPLSKIEVASLYDIKTHYGIDHANLCTYKEDELGYLAYNNTFSGVKNYKMTGEMSFSYSSMDEYNKCPFSYYLSRVLKIDTYTEGFDKRYGDFAHEILQNALGNPEFDIEEYYNNLDQYFLDAKEFMLARGLKDQLLKVIELNNRFIDISKYNVAECEKKHKLKIDDLTYIGGTIDKILIDEEEKKIIVVDYKTGGFKYDARQNDYGIGLQLPIYMMLLSNDYPDYEVVGLYIQNIRATKSEISKDGDLYLLDGFTINDLDTIKRIEPTLDKDTQQKSLFIKTIKITSKGVLDKRSRVRDEVFFKNLINIAERESNKAINNIRNGVFDISPIIFDGKKDTAKCRYCSYSDICYHTNNDFRNADIKGGASND